MILSVYRQGFTDAVSGRLFNTAPQHQYAISFQPEVVVQPAVVVLLDDKRISLISSRFHWFR